MSRTPALPPATLCQRCDPSRFSFETTEELEPLPGIIGQERAIEAIRFGIGIHNSGYNIYALGPAGVGKHAAVRELLQQQARDAGELSDWCYVNNFRQPARPRLLRLPAGRGSGLRDDMLQLVKELRAAIPAAFERNEYLVPLRRIEDEFEEHQRQAFAELQQEAGQHDIRLIEQPGQFTFVPLKDGKPIPPDVFASAPEEERRHFEQEVAVLQARLQEILDIRIPRWQRETRNRVRELNRKTTTLAVRPIMAALRERYQGLSEVEDYLARVEDDVIDNADAFRTPAEAARPELELQTPGSLPRRYSINLIVDNAGREHAPVIYEDKPDFNALLGRIEHTVQLGTLVTDFTQIRAGALQRANGGYLILDAHRLLAQPWAWDGLKRSLFAGEVRIESLSDLLSLVNTVSLEPDPVPLDVKVVLLGDRLLYYLLHEFDPDFAELFKVSADFDTSLQRTPDSEQLYARLLATLAAKEGLHPFDRHAIAAMIRFSMRLVEDSRRLSMHMRGITDLMQEASHHCDGEGRRLVNAGDVDHAWEARIRRHSRARDRLYEAIQRGTLMIDTDGRVIGQANGLTVVEQGDFSYGIPTRITATTRLGEGEVIDIERETDLGGPIHSKGVFILSSFLGARYARNLPLSLAASLTFEQSYSTVEGDSASLAELCALLSSLAGVPLLQSLGITGSVNQLGRVQAIGGVNEKIEGFFDICRQRGLNGDHGVVIPAANVEHLMLRDDLVEAARSGQFSIYAVDAVDQAIELLTGLEAGTEDEHGMFPEGSFNQRVQARLTELAELRRSYGEAPRQK
ncbi:MAG TPA: ATP-dependent protease [Gammaproteobacteria bacterium]|nr:ATP-dependent protease [Gammaproteobacteria bacterium]